MIDREEIEAIAQRVRTAEESRKRSRRNSSGTFDARMVLDIQASSMDVPRLLETVLDLQAAVDATVRLADDIEEKSHCSYLGRDIRRTIEIYLGDIP